MAMKRVCAICGKTYRGRQREATMGFRRALWILGHPNWNDDKAHPSCIQELQKKADATARKPG